MARPYIKLGIIRRLLIERPELIDANENVFRDAFINKLIDLGFDASDPPNDIVRSWYDVKAEIRDNKIGSLEIFRNKDYENRLSSPVPQYSANDKNIDVFSDKIINRILRTVDSTSNKVKMRESAWVEFKANFNFDYRQKYAKIMAAFANNQGGYIVFGVDESTQEIEGMNNDKFINFDAGKLNQYLLKTFSPMVDFETHVHHIDGKKFGLIYTHKSQDKPVIALSNEKGIIEDGAIYYKYPAESKLVRSHELKKIIEESIRNKADIQVQKQDQKWHNLLMQLTKISPQNSEILDLANGRIGDIPVLIDRETLSKIKLIREGEFNEREGAPTLKLVGQIEDPAGVVVVPEEKHIVIDQNAVVITFLDQECKEPTEYLKYLISQTAHKLPLWFFLHSGNMSPTDAIDFLLKCNVRSESVRNTYIARLREGEDLAKYGTKHDFCDIFGEEKCNPKTFDDDIIRLINEHSINKRFIYCAGRTLIYSSLITGDFSVLNNAFVSTHIRYVLEAITLLNEDIIRQNEDKIIDCLKDVKRAIEDIKDWNTFRYTLCYVDAILYAPKYLLTRS